MAPTRKAAFGPHRKRSHALATAAGMLLLASCAGRTSVGPDPVGLGPGGAPESSPRSQSRPLPPAREIVAIIDGSPISRDEVLPALFERAGREVLDELTLDRRLRAELARRGLALTPSLIQEEDVILAEVAGVSSAEVRRRAGISSERFRASLERSAMLRMLARGTLGREADARTNVSTGPIRERSALVVRTEASEARAQAWPETAALVTVRESSGLDSAAQPISPALAEAIFTTPVGETTPVVLTPGGSVRALVLAERSAPADTAAQSRARRLSLERDAMERIARELLARPGVTVMERGLAERQRE